MVQPLKFRELALSRLDPDDLLSKLETAVRTTHKITKAADASKIPLDAVMKHLLETLLAIVVAEVRQPLVDMFDKHILDVEDEYELMEGEAPAEGEDADWWWTGLFAAQEAAFEGEVIEVLGRERVRKMIQDDEPTTIMVDEILKTPIVDYQHMLVKLHLTPEQLGPIAHGIHTNWKEAAPSDASHSEVSGPDDTGPDDAASEPPVAGAAPKRTRTPRAEASPVTEATRAFLEALVAHSGANDGDLATALGISRPTVNNYKNGKTPLDPSDTQISALLELARSHIAALTAACEAFEVAVL